MNAIVILAGMVAAVAIGAIRHEWRTLSFASRSTRSAAETDIPVGRFAIRDGAIPKLKSQLVPEHAVFWLPHLEGVSVVVTTSDIALHWPGVPTPETFIHGSELLIALVAGARRSSAYR